NPVMVSLSNIAGATIPMNGAPLAISTTSLPTGVIGLPYSEVLTATGGMPPYSWSISSGRLPAGLILAGAPGQITGMHTNASNSVVTFQVKDSSSPSQTATASLIVNVVPNILTITTTSLPNGQVGVPYFQSIQTLAGTPPFKWELTGGGALPPG